jgi:hypothetical protein
VSGCGHGVPAAERTRTQPPLLGGTQLMSSAGEQVPYDIMDGKEALCLCSRSKAHVALALPRGLVGDFGPVVGVAGGVMHDRRHDDSVRGAVAVDSA